MMQIERNTAEHRENREPPIAHGDSPGSLDNTSGTHTTEYLHEQARSLRFRRRSAEAIELLTRAIQLSPVHGQCHLDLSLAMLDCGQWNGAVVEAKRSQALGVINLNATAVMGLAYVELGQFDRARSALNQVGPSLQGNARLLTALGKCHRAVSAWHEAHQAFAAAAKLAPQSAKVALELGVALGASGQLDDAETELRRACQLDPSYADAYFELGCILLNHRKRYRESLLCNQKVIELNPNHWGANVNCAASLINLNLAAEAEPLLRCAIRIDPRQPVAWQLMGCIHLQASRFQPAMDVLEHGLKLAGTPGEQMLYMLREAGEKVGDREALLARLNRLLKAHRRWALLHAMKGITLHDLNRFSEAGASYKLAMRLGLHEPWLYLNQYRLLCKDHRPQDAMRVIRRGLARWPDNLELVYHLGMAYFGMNRPIEAQRVFARLFQRDPRHAEAAYLAGDLLMQRGRKFYRRAVAYYHCVIELDPNHRDALWNLAAIYQCWRRIPEARHYLARAEAAGARYPRLQEFKRSLGMP
jgi:tetratricopeptide (TPR) repeat protein